MVWLDSKRYAFLYFVNHILICIGTVWQQSDNWQFVRPKWRRLRNDTDRQAEITRHLNAHQGINVGTVAEDNILKQMLLLICKQRVKWWWIIGKWNRATDSNDGESVDRERSTSPGTRSALWSITASCLVDRFWRIVLEKWVMKHYLIQPPLPAKKITQQPHMPMTSRFYFLLICVHGM